jgi:hypothetical protein
MELLTHLFQKWLVKVNPGLDAKFVPQFSPTCCHLFLQNHNKNIIILLFYYFIHTP